MDSRASSPLPASSLSTSSLSASVGSGRASTAAASSAVSARRASPDDRRMSAARASGSTATVAARPRGSSTARSTRSPRSSSVSGRSVRSSDRDSSGEMTENDGFSVVAAMSTTQPFSTPGSRASCCALVKRWISSRKRMVDCPYRSRWVRASCITSRTSLTPAVMAESSTNRRFDDRAMACARVVFPVPGGPHRITEVDPAVAASGSARATSGDPLRSRCPCPATSARLAGRMRTASGVCPWKSADELTSERLVAPADTVASFGPLGKPRNRRG